MRRGVAVLSPLLLVVHLPAQGMDRVVVDDTTRLRVEIVQETAESLLVRHKGEERAFPIARVTELLKKVFGSLDD